MINSAAVIFECTILIYCGCTLLQLLGSSGSCQKGSLKLQFQFITPMRRGLPDANTSRPIRLPCFLPATGINRRELADTPVVPSAYAYCTTGVLAVATCPEWLWYSFVSCPKLGCRSKISFAGFFVWSLTGGEGWMIPRISQLRNHQSLAL